MLQTVVAIFKPLLSFSHDKLRR